MRDFSDKFRIEAADYRSCTGYVARGRASLRTAGNPFKNWAGPARMLSQWTKMGARRSGGPAALQHLDGDGNGL